MSDDNGMVNFHMMMPDNTMRHIRLPFVKGMSLKEYGKRAIEEMEEEDKKEWKKRKKSSDDEQIFYIAKNYDIMWEAIANFMDKRSMKQYSFIKIDQETKRPVTMYTMTKETF